MFDLLYGVCSGICQNPGTEGMERNLVFAAVHVSAGNLLCGIYMADPSMPMENVVGKSLEKDLLFGDYRCDFGDYYRELHKSANFTNIFQKF